jgi:uncharacterized membrane protein YjfL (UPF0719 family)
VNYLEDLASALAYGVLGLVLLVIGYYVIDLLTPGHLGAAITQGSRSGALVLGAMLLALGAVVAASIVAARGDNLLAGLGETLGYSLVGIVLLGLAFKIVDVLTPGSKLGDVLESETTEPVAWVLAAFMVGVGATLAAAIS